MKSNKFIKWLYGLFMFVPFLAIGVKSMYVTFNKNAKDSYAGTKVQEVEVIDYNFNELETNGNYYCQTSLYNNTPSSNVIGLMYVDNLTLENDNTDLTNVKQIRFVNYSSGVTTLQLRNSEATTIKTLTISSTVYKLNFNYISTSDINIFNLSCFNYYRLSYNNDYYLDNAFYYAIDEFNSVGFDKINFVSWFNFLYENTNVYTTFINCYVNYMLFVSLAFFIPRVLYWFINFAYSLTDSFSGKSNGGGW